MADSELREVYSAGSVQEAHFLKFALEDAGIDAHVVGDHLQMAVGDLPAVAIAPRIWVHARNVDKARKVVADQLAKRGASPLPSLEWICSACREPNESTFEICWSCQAPRDPEQPG